jgi:hypothetical protein
LIARSTRADRTWRVSLFVGDADSSSGEPEVVVVRYQHRYYVC